MKYATWAEPNPDMPFLQKVLIDAVLKSDRPQVLLARDSGLSTKHVNQMLLGRCEGSLSSWQALLSAAGVDLIRVIPLGEHSLEGAACSCGWEARLGESIHRGFDRHLLESKEGRS